jgi:hypothetical protein
VSKVFYPCVDYESCWEAALFANLTCLLHGFRQSDPLVRNGHGTVDSHTNQAPNPGAQLMWPIAATTVVRTVVTSARRRLILYPLQTHPIGLSGVTKCFQVVNEGVIETHVGTSTRT